MLVHFPLLSSRSAAVLYGRDVSGLAADPRSSRLLLLPPL